MDNDSTPKNSAALTDPTRQPAADRQDHRGGVSSAAPQPATVLVRGEAVGVQPPHSGNTGATPQGEMSEAATKPLSEAKVKLQGRLPALTDDADLGVQQDHVVVRDGKADLAFNGTLLASAAPSMAPHAQWQEFRVYETSAGKFVFSKITRHLALDEEDEHEAEIFEPEPSSKSSQLLRNARDLTRAHPLTWKDEAVDFFGYEPLAKTLYRKLGDDFEEHVS